MTFYLAGRSPSVLQRRLSEIALATNWPEDHLSRYESVDLIAESEILQRLKSTGLPIIADQLLHIKYGERGRDQNHSSLDGFAKSIALPVFDAEQRPYFFLFSGNMHHFEDRLISELLLQSMRLLNASLPPPRKDLLSLRETDCLGWVAAGKSSGEIATRLSLSAHTVNEYLQSATKKLNAINRTQAAVTATKMGLL
ncbi:hypothetical protein GFL49_32760 [Rhizobium leguminosarum bv. viciae]|nr:hypothetical protein [Rhizobium leguminosarum bv. viciae]